MAPEEKWRGKYRPLFGCENPKEDVCWCKVCCHLEAAYDDVLKLALEAVQDVRHPAKKTEK